MRAGSVSTAVALVVLLTAGADAPSTSSPGTVRGLAQAPQTYKGLELSVSNVARAINVSLTDCPQGQNIVRGVIKPGDTNEFASITVDFKVTPAFKPTTIPKPVLHDEGGKVYNTAQSFTEIAGTQPFSCTFSFRVPKGAKLARLVLDTATLDLRAVK